MRSVKESVANTILKHIKMHSKILCDREKGAFGRVFLAKKDGKEYALKETLSSGRKATKAAQRESKLMIELDHINIVKLYEYFTFGHPAKCFMIMVWFPRKSDILTPMIKTSVHPTFGRTGF